MAEDRPKFGKITPGGIVPPGSAAPPSPSPPTAASPAASWPAAPPSPPGPAPYGMPPGPGAPSSPGGPTGYGVPVVPLVHAAPPPSATPGAIPMVPAVPLIPAGATPMPSTYGFTRRVGKTRDPLTVWVLVMVTLGFYGLYWYYKVNEELREYDPSIKVDPAVALCAVWFGWILLFIPTIVSWVNTGSRISQAQRASGGRGRANGVLMLLANVFPGGGYVYGQKHLNMVWARHGSPREGTPV